MVLYSKFTYGSQFLGEKNALEIRFPVAEKLSKYKRSIFFETPCSPRVNCGKRIIAVNG